MRDYIIREDAYMALTGDITDCTIEEFIARLRDRLSKLASIGKDINVTTNEDCINRQAVIDLYEKYHPYLATKVYEFGQELRKLPSVSPELVNNSQDLVKQLESLESEYNAYHLDNNDYWRGVKHAIEVLKFRQG